MKKTFIGILLVLVGFSTIAKEKEAKAADTESIATTILTGSIADNNSGESLVGVEVKLEGTDLKTYTDFDGNFSFNNVKPGEYKLITNYISYQKKMKILNVSSQKNELKIKLQTSN
ncbi:MAG: carboxypeptidase-like regulatory domain-containing protein [Draconibacterium sp.]|nr:carboxypeptidase-like regulatory domain-containing protein [Draconibacterium sp.]